VASPAPTSAPVGQCTAPPPAPVKPRPAKANDGSIYTVFTPAISGKSAKRIRQEIRRMRFHLRSDLSFEGIAKMINLKAGPWATYYGRFRPSETAHVLFHIDRYLVRWATRKYKHLRRAPRRAGRTLAEIKKARPGLLAHWRWELRTRLKTARAG
jgi:RNA-directed DNA polymerase